MSAVEASPSTRLIRAAAAPATGGPSLSPELEAGAAMRLAALALAVAGTALVLGAIDLVAGTPSAFGPRFHMAALGLAVVLSLAVATAITSGALPVRRALALGLGYEVVQGLLMAVSQHAVLAAPGMRLRGWSPVAVWVLVYPLVVPGAPARVLAATLATAAMDPLGLCLTVSAGAPPPSPARAAETFLPTLLAALLAPIGGRIVRRLTVEVKRAREMGSYLLVERLGQGGMGEVWRAEHRMLARSAAIKLIRPEALGAGAGSRDREMTKRFEREARATAALRSPHTIEVYDYGVAADGTFHYVMELLDGWSLQELVERFGPVPPERAVSLLRQACHSLAEAHAAGLVHRDIKPANLFTCRLGLDVDFVKVLDFGLVKLRGPAAPGAEALTMAGTLAGTPAYMPPEMALGAERVDGRADIYALGCVAYWLLTGSRVFEAAKPMQLVIDHVHTPPLPPSRRATQAIPAALDEIVLRCLRKEPDARFATVAELRAALAGLGLEGQWSERRARDWWASHEPAGHANDRAADASGASSGETRSLGPAGWAKETAGSAAPTPGARRPGSSPRR